LAATIQSGAVNHSAPATAKVHADRRLKEIFGENFNFPADSLKQLSEMEEILEADSVKRDNFVSNVLKRQTPRVTYLRAKGQRY
jgi:hypothetical protein